MSNLIMINPNVLLIMIFVFGFIFLHVCSVTSVVSNSLTLWTVVCLSMGFSRQEYWSGLPHPPPGDLPNPEIKSTFPALAGGFFTHQATGEAQLLAHTGL